MQASFCLRGHSDDLLEHLLLIEVCLTTQALSSPAPSTCIPSLQPGLFFFTAFNPLRIFSAYQFAFYCLSPLWEYWFCFFFFFFHHNIQKSVFVEEMNQLMNKWLSINITPNETIYIICSVLLRVHLRRSYLSNQIINSQDVTSKLLLQPWKSSTVLNKYHIFKYLLVDYLGYFRRSSILYWKS